MTLPHTSPPNPQAPHRARRRLLIAAWSIPVLVIAQFALLAVVPLVLAVRRVVQEPALRSLRPWVAALTAVYVAPLALWLLQADRPGSLSKDISPVFVALIIAAALAVIVRIRGVERPHRPLVSA